MRDLSELKINDGFRPITAGPLVDRPAPTADQIGEFETYFGVSLPPDYRAFLCFCNGGHPHLSSFWPKGREASWEVSFFYHLGGKDEPYGIWRAASAWKNAGKKNSIPIARDPFGNKILLCFDTTPPCVRLFIHDDGDEATMCDVAESFADFVAMLYLDPETVLDE